MSGVIPRVMKSSYWFAEDDREVKSGEVDVEKEIFRLLRFRLTRL